MTEDKLCEYTEYDEVTNETFECTDFPHSGPHTGIWSCADDERYDAYLESYMDCPGGLLCDCSKP